MPHLMLGGVASTIPTSFSRDSLALSFLSDLQPFGNTIMPFLFGGPFEIPLTQGFLAKQQYENQC